MRRYTISCPTPDGYEVKPWEPGLFVEPTEVVLASDFDRLRRELAEVRGLLLLVRRDLALLAKEVKV